MKTDDKQENLDNTQSRKKKAFDRIFSETDEDLANILINLQSSVKGKNFTSNFRDILT